MNSKLKKAKGFFDVLPDDYFSSVKRVIFSFLERRNYKEIITPIVEKRELYERVFVAGDTIANHEMFTFQSKSGVELVLRPEATGSVMRAVVENSYYQFHQKPIKLFYFGKMFRYERPQKNRQREFNQFGVEILGGETPCSDVEAIATAYDLITTLRINHSLKLLINYFGSKTTKEKYLFTLKSFLAEKIIDYCENCLVRYRKNTLRILDCAECKNKFSGLPKISLL
jgi:histidyl-tRNA synthetase